MKELNRNWNQSKHKRNRKGIIFRYPVLHFTIRQKESRFLILRNRPTSKQDDGDGEHRTWATIISWLDLVLLAGRGPAARLTDADGQGVVLLAAAHAALSGLSLPRHLCCGLLAPRMSSPR